MRMYWSPSSGTSNNVALPNERKRVVKSQLGTRKRKKLQRESELSFVAFVRIGFHPQDQEKAQSNYHKPNALVSSSRWRKLLFSHAMIVCYLKACNIFRLGPLPGPLDMDAGALSLRRTTRTMLHRKRRLSSIDKHTGATRTFVYGLPFIQHLKQQESLTVSIG